MAQEEKKLVELLNEELIAALGCTEPIAIAYGAALGRRILGAMPERVVGHMSGNIVKNVKCVVVPNSGGRRGIDVAIALGLAAGDDSKKLEVIAEVTDDQRKEMERLLQAGVIHVELSESSIPLDIRLDLCRGDDRVNVRIAQSHLNVVHLSRNEKVLVHRSVEETVVQTQPMLSTEEILEFADTCPLEEVEDILNRQIECNLAIADEGLQNPWGSCVGQTIRQVYPEAWGQAMAAAAAGSDARMNGCELPVVINSGSGNQGITVSMPVVVYAKYLGSSHEQTLRALLVSNLLAICQKKQIGSLSAYCGAVSAGCAAAAGVAYLKGGSRQMVLETFSNGLDIVSGVICDGASASCAGKIAVGIFAGFLGMNIAENRCSFKPEDGIVGINTDDTVAHIGKIARIGMKQTDWEILKIMLENHKEECLT